MIFSDSAGQISKEAPSVSFLDHGFLFGDSLYEVVRVYDRKVMGWPEHRDRLVKTAQTLSIPIEPLLPEIERRMRSLLKALSLPQAALRLVITRGLGELHINTRSCTKPLVFMAAWKFEVERHSQPISLAIPKIRRNPRVALDPAIKSGNYLNSVLALREAQDLGCDDALFLNPEGEITELTTSNIGWIQSDGKIVTPDIKSGLLLGVTRRLLLEMQADCQTGVYREEDLKKAPEVFALSTFKEILPVDRIRWSDGTETRYSTFTKTQSLAKRLRDVIDRKLASEKEWF